MKNTAFATRLVTLSVTRGLLLSLSLCAASAMATETVSPYSATTTSAWSSNAGEHGALHHVSTNNGLGEAISIAKNVTGDASAWQTSVPNQNSVLLSSPGAVAASSLPASLSAGALLLTSTGEKTVSHVSAKVREFDTSAISQPGIYTMILIGIGLLSLRSRRKMGQDEKFAA